MSTRRSRVAVRRRELILAPACAAGLPGLLSAQPTRSATVGVLGAFRHNANPGAWDSFTSGLAARGWVQGRNLTVHTRHMQGGPEREAAAAAAAELAALAPDVLLITHSAVVVAAQAAMPTTPIVVVNIANAVETGLATSLARPGGQITGVLNQASDLIDKMYDLMRQMRPGMSRLGLLWSPSSPGSAFGYQHTAAAAKRLGFHLVSGPLEDPASVEAALAAARREAVEFLLVHPVPAIGPQWRRVMAWALEAKVGTVGAAAWVREGFLMSYWARIPDLYRRAAELVDRILRGAKPADLPIEQATTFQRVPMARTAKAMGIRFPQALPKRVDEVIQ